MGEILHDPSKFQNTNFHKSFKEVNYLVDKQAEINTFLNDLGDRDILSKPEVDRLKPHGSQPGILYGLCKVHKTVTGGIPPFRPILSAFNTLSCHFWELTKTSLY